MRYLFWYQGFLIVKKKGTCYKPGVKKLTGKQKFFGGENVNSSGSKS